MFDQVAYLQQKIAVSAAAIYDGQSEEVLDDIENGEYSIVYASPESLLAGSRWRNVLSSEGFRKRFQVIVIDEAHCMVHW